MNLFSLASHHQTIASKLSRVSWPLLVVVCLIAGIGLASLYSVAGGSYDPWGQRHAFRFVACVGMVLVIAMTPLRLWIGLAYPAYAVALLLLLLVPFAGSEALGAKRWLAIGGFTFQPAELMKVALVAMLARYYQWLGSAHVSRPIWVALPLLAILLPVVLTLKQPDLGTAVLFAVVGLLLMFLAGVNVLYFVSGAVGCAMAAPVVWSRLHDYQRRRVEVFLDPERDPLGAGYHITQSKIALGSGGLSGKGYMQGTQSQLNFLPEKHTDFIFTMFAEEWGLFGGLGLLCVYGVLLMLVLGMALRCQNQFARLVIAGTGIIIFVYAFINVAMVTGLVPVVGVPLPLVSYGGTSMTTIMFAIGIAMCGYVHRAEPVRQGDLGRII